MTRSLKNMRKIAAYIEKDPETGLYIGIVPGIPGAHTQGETLDELQRNLKEVLELCLGEMDSESMSEIPEFVGIQEIEVGS
jgi:predicted RNase H-like HicB family nuclease